LTFNTLGPWIPRLHFGLLLLIFGELVAWQQASTFSLLDWLALAVIYLALALACLDFMMRFRAADIRSVFLVAGLYAATRAALLSVIHLDSLERFAIDLVFLPMGLQTLMFLLAFASFRLLSTGESTGPSAFGIALVVGFGWGTWTRWSPALESINVIAPTWDASLPYVVIALVVGGIVPLVLHPRLDMQPIDWLMTPYEWAFAGLTLFVTLVLRLSQGHIDILAVGIITLLMLGLLFMLNYSTTLRRTLPFAKMTPPQSPLILGWLLILAPFALAAWAGYNLSDGEAVPWQAVTLFRALLLFGVAWLPVISIWWGANMLTQMTREGY
jgi:hypothetical protein